MRVRVVFLGPARDLSGCETVSLELEPGARVGDVLAVLADRYPPIKGAFATMRVAVNREFADRDQALNDKDEVALVPPVSGGAADAAIRVELVREPIDIRSVQEFVTGDPFLGGVTSFVGVTRAEADAEHGRLVHLFYEAYEEMALKQLERLAGEARRRWNAGRVALIHRLGVVPVAEGSVVIAVACGHRAASFEACRWLIDTLKKDVPIWKKDVYEDGFGRWVQPS